MTLIYGRLWESVSRSVKDGRLWFNVVPHKDEVFAYNLEVGTFPSHFILPSVPGQFLRADEELRRLRKVVDF